MFRTLFFLPLAAIIAASLAVAQDDADAPTSTRDTTPPTLTITIPSPALISDKRSIIFTGNVSDNVEVERVWFRPDGGNWRKATLNFSGTTATSATWAFIGKLRPKHRTTRFHIRAYDAAGNESDTIARPIKQK